MLPCHKALARLGRYHDRELPPVESRELRAHLETCGACRLELKSMEALDAVLDAAPVPPVYGDLVQNVMRAAREQEAEGDFLLVFHRFWYGWPALMRYAAACTAVAACYVGLVAGAASAPSPGASADDVEWLTVSSAGPIAALHIRGTP